eukprot:Gb_03603 [translate_table: standard]
MITSWTKKYWDYNPNSHLEAMSKSNGVGKPSTAYMIRCLAKGSSLNISTERSCLGKCEWSVSIRDIEELQLYSSYNVCILPTIAHTDGILFCMLKQLQKDKIHTTLQCKAQMGAALDLQRRIFLWVLDQWNMRGIRVQQTAIQGFRSDHVVNPWKSYITLAGVNMGSNGLTKGSLMFLNYPAQIMFKSTKVLPVMIMGAFIPGLRRKYPLYEYVSALLLVAGLIIFTLADANTSPNFHVLGVVMVSGALVMDAFLGNLQEVIFNLNPATSQMEMLFCSTAVGLPFLIPPMLLTGEVFTAWNACSKHPYVYLVLIFEAMATFIGQLSVLSLIAVFGAATTTMVTTARKALTLLLSYIIFTKPMTEQHATGLLLISMGIILKTMPNPMAKSVSPIRNSDLSESTDGKGQIIQLSMAVDEEEGMALMQVDAPKG